MRTEPCYLVYTDVDHMLHGWKNCETCRLDRGDEKCDGCKDWFCRTKLIPSKTMEDYKFCADCTEENPHPCADKSCDGLQFGAAKHCNICIGEAVNNRC